MTFQVLIDWGERSRNLHNRRQMIQKVSGSSFLLQPTTPPVQMGFLAGGPVGWEKAPVTALVITTDVRKQTASCSVPDGLSFLRLDFDLLCTVAGQSANVLSFKQLFAISSPSPILTGTASGALMPLQYSIQDVVLTPSANGPIRVKGSSPIGWRTAVGLHPLLSFSGINRFTVNAEFVDVTELWWKVHPDTNWGWYWHPDLKSRQEHLRVLAWTGGGNPMIWFVVIPDAAVPLKTKITSASVSGSAADIIYFRPPPGSNSFPYNATENGFAEKLHQDRTLVNLARYLLDPVPETTFSRFAGGRCAAYA